jgi:TonB family protein
MQSTSSSRFGRLMLAGALAAVMSGSALGAAISPAYAEQATAAAPVTVTDWVAQVEDRIASELRTPASLVRHPREGRAHVYLTLDREGRVTGSRISRTSDDPAVDAEVLRVARAISPLPLLPDGLHGKPVGVELQVYLGSDERSTEAAEIQAHARAENARLSTRLADTSMVGLRS